MTVMWLSRDYFGNLLSTTRNTATKSTDNTDYEKYIASILCDPDLDDGEKHETILSILTSFSQNHKIIVEFKRLSDICEKIIADYEKNPDVFIPPQSNPSSTLSSANTQNMSMLVNSFGKALSLNVEAKEFVPSFSEEQQEYFGNYAADDDYPSGYLGSESCDYATEYRQQQSHQDALLQEMQQHSDELSLSPMALLQRLFPTFDANKIMFILEKTHFEMEAAIDLSLHLHKNANDVSALLIEEEFARKKSTPTATSAPLSEHYIYDPRGTAKSYEVYQHNASNVVSEVSELPYSSDNSALQSMQYSQDGQQRPFFQRRPVCRHFLSGICYRKDCSFSHEFETKLCKFWLQGTCMLGSNCAFSHGDSLLTSTSAEVDKTMSNQISKDIDNLVENEEDYFPSLSEAADVLGASGIKKPSKKDKKARKDTNLKESVPEPAPLSTPEIAVSSPPKPSSTANKSSDQDFAAWTQSASTASTANAFYQPSSIGSVFSPISWPEVPSSSSPIVGTSPFSPTKTDSHLLALKRNSLFQRATEAYLSGQYALSKSLSLEATSINQQMNDLRSCSMMPSTSNTGGFRMGKGVLANGLTSLQTVSMPPPGLHMSPTSAFANSNLWTSPITSTHSPLSSTTQTIDLTNQDITQSLTTLSTELSAFVVQKFKGKVLLKLSSLLLPMIEEYLREEQYQYQYGSILESKTQPGQSHLFVRL